MKSFLVAIYACARCILYPGTKVIIVSGVKKQSALIISEKIVDLYNKSPALRVEIGSPRNISSSAQNAKVQFLNGSKIEAVVGNENSRGYRGNVLIVDEYRILAHDVVTQVVQPMGSVPRVPEFKTLYPEKYSDYIEDNVELYLSSAWYKSEWSWKTFERTFKNMINHEKIREVAVSIPYQIPLLHNMINGGEEAIKRIKEDDINPFGFAMEYEGLFVGGDENSMFKLDALNKIRTLSKTFVPPTDIEVRNNNKHKSKTISNMPKMKGEIRLVGLDVAMAGSNNGQKNDTAVYTLLRMIPIGDKFSRQLAYMESIPDAVIASDLSLRMKQLYYDFEADFAVLDAKGIGISVYDELRQNTQDDARDTEYAPWSAINDDRLADRISSDAIENLYVYKATKALNSEMALEFRSAIETETLKLPKDDIQRKQEIVMDDPDFLLLSIENQQRELHTYQQTSALVAELISLEATVSSGHYVVKEVGQNTKDRYSSLSYTNHRASEIEKEMKKPKREYNFRGYMKSFSWKKGR